MSVLAPLMDRYPQRLLQRLAPLIKIYLDPSLPEPFKTSIVTTAEHSNVDNRVWSHDGVIVSFVDDLNQPDLETASASPLDPDLDLFPNGILLEKWLEKYCNAIPMVFLLAVHFTSDHDEIWWADHLLALRKQLVELGSQIVVMVCSGDGREAEDRQRLQVLQSLTHLPDDAVFFVPSATAVPKVMRVINSCFPQWALSFYGKKLAKVQNRNSKFYNMKTNEFDTEIVLTPKFLETRNLFKQGILAQYYMTPKWSLAIKHLENGYNTLVEIISECFAGKFAADYPLTSHDIIVYALFRRLLDIAAFHIFRGYLAVGNPETALKKHAVHIKICNDITRSQYGDNVTLATRQCQYWTATQYELLADYLVEAGAIGLLKGDDNLVPFYGGMRYALDSTTQMDVFTDPVFAYLHAYNLVAQLLLDGIEVRDYMVGYETDIEEYRRRLLTKAIESASRDSFKKQIDPRGTTLLYLHWLLANHTSAKTKAQDLYRKSIAYVDDNSDLAGLMREKLVVNESGAKKIVELLKLPGTRGGHGTPLSVNISEATKVAVSPVDLVKVDVDIVNQSLAHHTFMYDTCVIQITLTPNVDLQYLQLVVNVPVLLVVNHVTAEYTGGEILVKNDASATQTLPQIVENGTANLLLLGKDSVVLHYVFCPEKLGTFKVTSVATDATLTLGQAVVTSNQNIGDFNKHQSYLKFYGKDGVKNVRTSDANWSQITVKPLQPKITIDAVNKDIGDIVIGETVNLDFKINFQHPSTHKFEGSVLLAPRIAVTLEHEFDKDLRIRVYWEGHKDDELLDLSESIAGDGSIELVRKLFVQVQNPVTRIATPTDATVQIQISSEISVEGITLEHDLASYEMPLIPLFAHEIKYSIVPRYGEDDETYMPSSFIINDDTTQLGLPLVSRLWQARLQVTPVDDVEIVKTTFDIRQSNNEISLEIVGETKGLTQDFTTTSKTGFSHRTVLVFTTAKVFWRKKGREIVNEHTTREWEVNLPMLDPRVLLSTKRDGENAHLRYVLENPTPRVFTFTTTMDTKNYDFSDPRNIVPSKQPPFPVMPFSRHVMDWYVKGSGDLPELKTFDVNYKVLLTTLVVD